MNSYFLVWNPGTGYAKVKHDTFCEAQNEAERLARRDKGQTFVVLKTVGGAVSTDIQRLDFGDTPNTTTGEG